LLGKTSGSLAKERFFLPERRKVKSKFFLCAFA
jgi:hypothetical protein